MDVVERTNRSARLSDFSQCFLRNYFTPLSQQQRNQCSASWRWLEEADLAHIQGVFLNFFFFWLIFSVPFNVSLLSAVF